MDKFTKVTIASILILIFLIFFFIFLGTFRKNHIREINISGGEESANFSDSKLIVKFARPIQRENIKERISISPETEFNVNFINNDLQLTFPNDLDESREYKVTLKKGILDIYGDELEGEFNYEFQTKKEYITYLNKGVGGDKDKIIQSNKEFNNKKILFESEKIKDFKKYENNLLVTIVNSDLTENLILKNLGLNSIRDFKLEKESILSIDINDNSVLFLSQRVEPKGRFLAPQGNSSINLFDIKSNSIVNYNPGNTAVNALFAEFTPDGKSVIYKSQDSFYYIAGLEKDAQPTGIGRFKTYGGFNKDLNKIVFTEFNPLETYSSFPFITIFTSDRELRGVTSGEKYVQDPRFFNKSDNVIFSENFKELESTTGLFKIMMSSEGEYLDVFKDENFSYEFPKLNYNDKYLIVERYSKEDLLDIENQRSFIDFRKPLFGDIVMYAMEDKKIIGICENCIEGEFNL